MQNWLSKKHSIIGFIFITVALVSFTFNDVKTITWKDLANIKYRRAFNPKENVFYDKPIFSKKLKSIDSSIVEIKGYIYYKDSTITSFVLHSDPRGTRHFHSVTHGFPPLHTFIQVHLRKPFKHLKLDSYHQIQGLLILKDSVNTLPYNLENAVFIK